MDLLGFQNAGQTYDALVGLVIVNDTCSREANYGASGILVQGAASSVNLDEMVQIHGGDNFDREIQSLVRNVLIPELKLGIDNQALSAPSIVVLAKNAISHILTGGPFVG